METENNSELLFEALPLTAPNQKHYLVMVAKATFQIKSADKVVFSDDPLPIYTADEPLEKSVLTKWESDIVPYKPKADFIVLGKAYSPGAQPVRVLDVSARIGKRVHTIRVVGDRQWQRSGIFNKLGKSRPEPFTEMPIDYEHAFGGKDPDSGEVFELNPLGKGYLTEKSKKSVEGVALPNLEDPKYPLDTWTDQTLPVIFGTRCKTWKPRVELGGTYDEKWQATRAPRLPKDFDMAFYNAAQANMQIDGYLKGTESILLENLHPEGVIRFTLPKLIPSFKVYKEGEETMITPVLDTLVCLPEEKTFYCVWRGAIPVNDLTAMEIQRVSLQTVE